LAARKADIDLADFDRCRELIPHAMITVGRYYDRKDRVAAYRLFRSVKSGEDLAHEIVGDTEAINHQSRQLRFLFP
jgi:hypothetical protein